MSVSEFRWDFPREVKCNPMHRSACIAPSLLRPRKKPCQFGEKCSSSPSEIVSLTVAAKRLFHQEHRTCMMRLSVKFYRSRCRLSSVLCIVHGVLVARVPERKPAPASHVCFFAVFVISSTPMPSSRLGQVKSSPVQSSPVLSNRVLSRPIPFYPVVSCPVLSCLVLSCLVLFCPVLSCPTMSC